MPQTIGALIVEAFGVSATAGIVIGGVTITYASIVGTAVMALLALALQPKPPKFGDVAAGLSVEEQQQTIRQPLSARRRYYGRNKASGTLALLETKDGVAYQVVAIASQKIYQFVEHWFADQNLELDDDGDSANDRYIVNGQQRVHVDFYTGDASQTANATLIAQMPTIWTSDHRGDGIAYVMVSAMSVPDADFNTTYPGGLPQYRAVFDGALVYDPRSASHVQGDESTYTWSENSAACILDYLTHADGYGLSFDYFSPALDDWIVQLNRCDEAVALKAGGTEKRYRLWGGYSFDERRRDVLTRFLASCDGWIYPRADGAIGLKVGYWDAPSVRITSDHILGYRLKQGSGPLRSANTIRAKFVSQDYNFVAADADPWIDDEDVALRGEKTATLDLEVVPSHAQARRLMKAAAARANPDWVGEVIVDLAGLDAMGERFIELEIDELDGLDQSFEVTSFQLFIEEPAPHVVIGVSALGAEAFSWDASTEEGTAPPVVDELEVDSVPLPGSAAASNVSGRIHATCADPGRDDLTFSLEYRLKPAGAWQIVNAAADTWDVSSPSLGGGTYEVRVRFLGGEYVLLSDVVI